VLEGLGRANLQCEADDETLRGRVARSACMRPVHRLRLRQVERQIHATHARRLRGVSCIEAVVTRAPVPQRPSAHLHYGQSPTWEVSGAALPHTGGVSG
jgi:hypothetical protein